ncbi:MAG: low affinity iron permease family protein [Sphingobacteriaceae bacterium]
MAKKSTKSSGMFERFANKVTVWTGSSYAFLIAFSTIIAWAVTGPVFDYSETWQLIINTSTTIITFLMVFLIQKTQNKDSKAIQLKLNELIAASEKSSNRMVDIENLTEDELDELHVFYKRLSELAKKERDIHTSHSIDVADLMHSQKSRTHQMEKKESQTKANAPAKRTKSK